MTHVAGSSPSTRGAHASSGCHSYHHRLIPVYAGSTRRSAFRWPPCTAHPRLRGEHLCRRKKLIFGGGSSPSTRGAHTEFQAIKERARLIPVYAGSTRTPPPPPRRGTAHPRLRGEHLRKHGITSSLYGSSPSTRGALSIDSTLNGQHRLIPVYAGSTCPRCP